MELPLVHYDLQLQDQVVAPGGNPNMSVAQLDTTTLTVTALQLGRVNLVFIYKNVHMRGAARLPNCTIYVVEAGFLGFVVVPGGRWILEVTRQYEISVEIYERENSMKVYVADNIRIKAFFPDMYFDVLASSVNSSYHLLLVKKDGVTFIRATLMGVLTQDGTFHPLSSPISHEQEVRIFLPIILLPSFLAFPHHYREVAYRYQIQVEGGSGNFTWISSNHSVAMVTVRGVVTTGVIIGQTVIQARDVMNPFHYGEIKVYILKLTKMMLNPVHADVEVGRAIDVPLVMYNTDKETKKTMAFTDCSLLPLQIKMDKQGVFSLIEGRRRPGPAFCSSIQLMADSPGHALVTVSAVVYQEHFHTSATFAAYQPLRALNPVEVALVTLQSVKEMVFEGGPRPWILEPSRFFLELKAENRETIHITRVRLSTTRKQDQYIYRILCLELWDQVLTFRVGNHPGVLNPKPATEAVQVRFICTFPSSMQVVPVYKVHVGAPPCPLPQHNKQLVPVSNSRSTVLELSVFDKHRRKFDNFSSLLLEWTLSNKSLAQFSRGMSMQMVAKDDGTGQTRLHGQHTLEVKQMKGSLLITVSFIGYEKGIIPKTPSPPLTSAAVELVLVDDVTVVPNNATMYNHPDTKEIFLLVEGSGYFLVNISDSEIVNISYQEADSWVQVTPIHPGTLTMAVYDLCLAFLGPALASLRVSDIFDLELDVVDKIEIGKTALVTLRVLDVYKRPFLNKYFRHMHLKLQAASSIVTLAAVDDQDRLSSAFLLRAVAVGQTTLVVTARDKTGRRLHSIPRRIEVFPPFRLIPQKITLIPHNMMQVMSEGGPQPQSIIHFSISNKTVARVNRLGQVTALEIGTAMVNGTIQAVNEDTGRVIVFSQDSVEVEVVQLRAVRIHAPATRLITGTEMPVYVVGVTSTQTPFSFSNSKPRLTFHWSMSKRDVMDLVTRHKEVSLQLLPENNFAMVVRTVAAGRTGLKVTVAISQMCPQGQFEGNVTELSDEVQILVFDKLQLFSPECPAEQILMSTNSQLKLYTNREGAAFVAYRILQCIPNSSVVEEDGQGLLTAGAITGSAVLEVTSLEPFGVNQSIITGIRVAPVLYLRISTSPRLYTSRGTTLLAFPLGMTLTFTVHFYDSIGERFHAQNTQLQLALNRDDLLLIGPGHQNYTYVAQAVNQGVTLLGIWDQKHPGMADYIPVVVEHAITPNLSEPVTMGDVICFNTHLVNQEGEPGTWQVSSGDVLHMDIVTGAAVVRNTGTVTIFHDIPGVVKTFREVVVYGTSGLNLNFGPKNYLTNAPNSTESYLLVSTNRKQCLKGTCSAAQVTAILTVLTPAVYVGCAVRFSNSALDVPASKIFHLRSEFSIEKGLYMCVITTRPQSQSVLQVLSTADTSVILSATILGDHHKRGPQKFLIPFLPAFFVNQSQLVFSGRQRTNHIRVLGKEKVLQALEVVSDCPAILVGRGAQSFSTPGLYTYPVRVLNLTSLQQAVPVFINISYPRTGQRAAVAVTAVSEDQRRHDHCEDPGIVQQLMGSYQVLLFTLFAVLASTAVIFLAYTAFLNRLHTVPVVYIPTAPAGYSSSYPTPLSFNARGRLQSWLWSSR
ncbi:nuclear pore membrane glycoprotein 210-like isoform X2 [Rhinatrema bivittatum]|nr:nuclear pore membrane glycoprotein 210-like isoform X2 [Rhinatrema bivittatum]XP_029437849.1 nuclear pore membrane glycoprotein 210-like isoform X2 [Rhinatrema bivittatum]